jgi:DNA-binding transcriptional ArsR family regulator
MLNYADVEAALKAIAEPRRRAILRLVRDEERTAGEIAREFDVTRPAISQHLSVLKEAGLVSERRDGTRRFYRARPEGLRELQKFLEEFWKESLQRLKAAAEWEERRKRRAPK